MNCWDSLGGIVGASYRGQVTISDCWFGGEIVVNSIQAPVGGIIGYGKGVSMVNCLVATKEIGNDGWENTYWLGYVAGMNGSLSVTEHIRMWDHFRGFLTDKAM